MEGTHSLTAASVAASLAQSIQEAEQTPVAPMQPADVSFLRDPTPWDPMLMAQLLHASSVPGVWPSATAHVTPEVVPAAVWPPAPIQGPGMPDFSQQFAAAYPYLTPPPKERAPRRKRARILREGQLTMIVYGANEALTWARRVAQFTSVMRGVLGDRRRTFTWSGSVMDSVVGAFLTQNVSDSLSARAYMEVTSRWPSPLALGSSTDTADWEAVRVAPPGALVDAIKCRGLQVVLSTNILAFLNHVRNYSLLREAPHWAGLQVSDDVMAVMGDVLDEVQGRAAGDATAAEVERVVGDIMDGVAPRERREHVDLAYEQEEEEEEAPQGLNPAAAAAAATELLSLEWLRHAPDEEARNFLMSVNGLGRKSVACIMLLTLGKKEFPVDTNVGRICSRLGWIPLDAAQAIEDLDDYAPEPEVHAYLRSRLLGFDIETLYELHYQMITLGKVFCTKQNPNCKSCPMNQTCEYAQHNGPSLHGRKRVRVAAADPFTGLAPTSPTQGVDQRPKRMHWKTIQKMERLARETEALELARAEHLRHFSSAPLEYLVASRSPRPRTPGLRRPRGTQQDPVSQEARQAAEMAAQAALSTLWFKYRPPRWLPIGLIHAAIQGKLPDSMWDGGAPDENAEAWLKSAAEGASAAPISCNPLREIEVSDETVAQHVFDALQKVSGPAAWDLAHVPARPRAPAQPAPPPLVLKSKPVAVDGGLQEQQESVETPVAAAVAVNEAVMEEKAEQPGAAAAPQAVTEQQQQAENEAMDFVPDEEMYAAEAADMEHAASEWGQFPSEVAAEALTVEDEAEDGGSDGVDASAAGYVTPSPHSAIEAECARLEALAREMAEENAAMAKVADASEVATHKQRLLDLSLQVLNIDASLTVESAEEVVATGRSNYRQLARALHPDKCSLPGATDAFAGLGMAMNIVTEFAGGASDAAAAAAAASAPPVPVAPTAPEDHMAWNTSRLVVIAHVLPARLHACFPHLTPDGYSLGADQVLFLPVDSIPTFSREIVAGRAAPASALAEVLGGGAAEGEDAFVDGMLLVGCRAALRERFPLNGTYFQINEVFVDDTTAAQPVRLPQAEVSAAERCPLYFGLGIHYMSKAMTQEEVTFMFAHGRVCFRAFNPRTRAPMLLPKFLMPSIPTNSKSTWLNKKERAEARVAKAMRSGLPLPAPAPAPGMRLLRVPLSSGEVVPPPAALVDGQTAGRLSLEVMAPPPLPMLMGPVPTTPPAAAKKRAPYHDAYSSIETETYAKLGPGQPKSQDLADRKSGKGQARRRMLAPIIKSSQRCGQCKACLNPGWKKACETRRAEQLGFAAGQQQVYWAAAGQAAAAAQAAQVAATAAAMAQVMGTSQADSVPSDSATVQLMPPPPPVVVLPAAVGPETV